MSLKTVHISDKGAQSLLNFIKNHIRLKLYRNLCEAVVEGLLSTFDDHRYADKVIEKAFKMNPRWGARDRRFVAETIYDIVRWKRLYEFAAGSADPWCLLGVWCISKNIDLPRWSEFSDLEPAHVVAQIAESKSNRALRESFPDWLDALLNSDLGSRWESESAASNQEAKVVLRTNRLKTTPAELRKLLRQNDEIESELIQGRPDALELSRRQNVFGLAPFRDGLFEIQDAGSQQIAPFLQPLPGHRVIDACAGAGGKTLHLASLMNNKGRIIALDTEEWKLEELRRRARRAGASTIEARVIDSSKVIKRLEASADRLLLDVPCSGTGVFKRNPDAKWKLSQEFVDRMVATQQKILDEYTVMLKSGGMLVYSTCSLLGAENENQVNAFMDRNSGGFELLEQHRTWPSEGYDGFYMALLKKK